MSVPRITELLSNRTRIHTIAITIANAAAAQTDTITIDGVACAFTSDATPTKQEVSNGLIAAIAAASVAGMFEVSQGAAPGYDITLRPVGPFLSLSVSVSANLTLTQAYGLSKIENDVATMQDDMALIKAGIPLTAGEAHLGEVGGNTIPIIVTPAIGAAAFHANDIVGGKLTILNAGRVAGGSGIWHTLRIADAAKQAAALEVYLFSADLTVAADNAAEATSAADMLKYLGHVEIPAGVSAGAGYWKALANAHVVTVKPDIDYKVASGTSLFAFIRCTGTPTFTANCLQLTFGLLRD